MLANARPFSRSISLFSVSSICLALMESAIISGDRIPTNSKLMKPIVGLENPGNA